MRGLFCTAIASALMGCARDRSIQITAKDLVEIKPHGEQAWRGDVRLGNGVTTAASIEVTSKGNGSLKILNLNVRVYDAHDDMTLFEPSMANVRFIDLDGDGFLDLFISTLEIGTDEVTGAHLSRRPIAQTFLYRPDRAEFEELFSPTRQ